MTQQLEDMVSVKKADANNYCRILAALGMEEEGDPIAEIESLKALSVKNILVNVVPGEDGMGHEIYATSVDEVVNKLSDMGSRIEDYELGIAQEKEKSQIKAKLEKLRKLNNQLQDKTTTGSPEWHMHESIDDLLHEMLD